MSGRLLKGDRFIIHPEIPFIASLFVNVPDTKIWLTNPAPAGFLRWEGPIVLPDDPLIRVDLLSGARSGRAQPVRGEKGT
jgi:J protein